MTRGRPTTYKPEYCEQLIDHMSQGFSFESFAGVLTTTKETLYNWIDAHSDFLYAKSIAFEKSRLFWEDKGINNLNADKFQQTTYIFNMKNRFPKEWRDRTEVETSGNIEHSLKLTPDDRKDLIQALLNEREQKKI